MLAEFVHLFAGTGHLMNIMAHILNGPGHYIYRHIDFSQGVACLYDLPASFLCLQDTFTQMLYHVP
ncbi:hypothetical protein D3C73_1228390 [compost metagenome]